VSRSAGGAERNVGVACAGLGEVWAWLSEAWAWLSEAWAWRARWDIFPVGQMLLAPEGRRPAMVRA